MKFKLACDPLDWPEPRRPRRLIGLLAALLSATTLGGLALRAAQVPDEDPGRPIRRMLRPPMRSGPDQVAPGNLRLVPSRAADRFVIEAPAELDRKMVLQAPADLDAEMVINPETGRWRAPGGGPARNLAPRVPGAAKGKIPVRLPDAGVPMPGQVPASSIVPRSR